uniref:Uncharacterized protein n=1 Tax=Oryza sativa subsp. japonica TaxID=39947 RepID=Q8LHV9_ORYSJ|nr:hypothetical protein [Oryza sativa Japonica Group]BAD30958.1 hypothetical protein [Oryza sativa Japonica Group]
MRQAARGPAPAAQGGPGMAFPCSILCHYCLHVAPHIRYERVRRRCGDGGGALGGRGALVRGGHMAGPDWPKMETAHGDGPMKTRHAGGGSRTGDVASSRSTDHGIGRKT